MTTLETLLHDPDLAGVWNLVPDRSAITFKVSNLWGLLNVKGRFTEFSGDGQLTGTGAVFGRLDIRAAALDTGIGRRDKHLRSADFFDVERFAEISVVVTAVHPTQAPLEAGPPTFAPRSPSRASPRRCRCRPPSPSSTTARSGSPGRPRSIAPGSTWAGTGSA